MLQGVTNRRPQPKIRGHESFRRRPGRVPHLHQVAAPVCYVDVIGLGDVVVLGGHPEHRNDGTAQGLPQAVGQRDRAERLVQGKQWSPEEPRLLAGTDGQAFGAA